MAVRVKAIKLGFDGIRRRRPGEIFDIPDTMPLGKWMVRVEDQPQEPAPEKKRRGRPPKQKPEVE